MYHLKICNASGLWHTARGRPQEEERGLCYVACVQYHHNWIIRHSNENIMKPIKPFSCPLFESTSIQLGFMYQEYVCYRVSRTNKMNAKTPCILLVSQPHNHYNSGIGRAPNSPRTSSPVGSISSACSSGAGPSHSLTHHLGGSRGLELPCVGG
jgi:hypothetical protein